MNADFGFSLHSRGLHRLAGRTVLQIAPALADPALDGGAIAVAAALAEAGARPLVAAPPGHLVSELQANGGVWLDFAAQSGNPLTMAISARRLRKLIGQEQVDIVHARSRRAGWLAYAANGKAGVPLVTSFAQVSPGRSVLQQRYDSVMAKGDAVIASSRFAASTITALFPAAAGRVTLIRPGVDLQRFAPGAIAASRVQALREAWAVASDERIVLLVARPSIWKGHKVLIEAVRLLVARGVDDLKLVLVGDAKGAFGREIELATRAPELQTRVKRVAECADMPAALLAAAAVVVPSLEAEAFGRIAVEAQGVGTPVVVSDLGALPETVLAPPDVKAAARTGWRISPSDPAGLADALGEALALGASARDALGLRARRHVEDRFGVERAVRETIDLYATLLERKAAAA